MKHFLKEILPALAVITGGIVFVFLAVAGLSYLDKRQCINWKRMQSYYQDFRLDSDQLYQCVKYNIFFDQKPLTK